MGNITFLSEKRQGEIALAILKKKIMREEKLPPNLNEFERRLGVIAKEIDIPQEELKEFAIILLREKFNTLFPQYTIIFTPKA